MQSTHNTIDIIGNVSHGYKAHQWYKILPVGDVLKQKQKNLEIS